MLSNKKHSPPLAKRVPHEIRLHGEVLRDDYFWLREWDNPEVLAYLQAENQYTAAMMHGTETLQENLYQEMVARIKETDQTVPYRKGRHTYYVRTEAGKQYPIHCRKEERPDAIEEIVLDLNELAAGCSYLSLGIFEVSDDGRLLAYSTDTRGFREFTLYIKDLASGQLLAETRTHVDSAVWALDNSTLLLTVEDSAKRPWRALCMRLGHADDPVVYEEPDERFRLYASRTLSGDFLLLSSRSHTTSEVRFAPAANPAGPWQLIAPREPNHKYDVSHRSKFFYIRSNRNGGNFGLYRVPVNEVAQADWDEVDPPRDDVVLEEVILFSEHMVLVERKDGLSRFRIRGMHGGEEKYVEFPEAVYHARPEENHDFCSANFRYAYSSLVIPNSVFDVHMDSGASTLLKRDEIGGGFNPNAYRCERVHAQASDGTPVPISLVYRGHMRPAAPSPLLLVGYGAYGISMPAAFSATRISLLDRGVVFAIAHVRGGGELGKAWHDAGRMLAKKNTFDDFHATVLHLLREGVTASDRLAIYGGSAGGLLIGAVLNQWPELFRAAVMVVPFVDLIHSMLDESLPLTVGEFEEWGNPKIEKQFHYMRSYCPYSNLAPRKYPNILVRGSRHDSQVMYWEPAKYVARLRALCNAAPNVWLHMNLDAGHNGASGRYDRMREVALDYAYLLQQLGRSAAGQRLNRSDTPG